MDVEVASDPQPSLLLTLPVETVVHILEFCEYEDLVACTMTCKVMKEVVASHDSLQYILALACAGLTKDASDLNPGIPLSTKLA
ncbi:hypothetical protein PENSPDRAFT_690710 [Peniophora sp. CONT]|nr:hypothetical protein PENSPDRAFT_690710 [Peniophora sp. CONT]